MPYTGSLEDRIAIRELQEMYGDSVNQKNKHHWLSLWNDNASWVIVGREYKGKAEIGEKWEDFYSPFNPERGNVTRFYTSIPGSIEIEKDSAVSRLYVSVLIINSALEENNYIYSCAENYAKHSGKWLIKYRSTIRMHPPIL